MRIAVVEEKIRGQWANGYNGQWDSDARAWIFSESDIPGWLHATREIQEDGTPGVFLVSPSAEDYRQFDKLIEALWPIGIKCGAVKVKVPEEWYVLISSTYD